MKKNLFSYFAMFVAILCFSALFSSCQQDEEILSIATGDEEIVFKMSVPTSPSSISSRSISENASSANTASDYQNIKEGDTVNVYNLQNINILISAESAEGWIIKGEWDITLSGPEKGLLKNDQNLYLSMRPGAYASKESMVAVKPEKLGVYTVKFKKDDKVITFYIGHYGTPGTTGDEENSNYIFRMEKNEFQIGNTNKNGYTIYLKSDEYIMGKKVKALVRTDNGSTFTTGGGHILKAEELTCYKSEYSPGYIYFSFLPSEITPLYGLYMINFYSGSFYDTWYEPESMDNSNWYDNGQIRFMDMK